MSRLLPAVAILLTVLAFAVPTGALTTGIGGSPTAAPSAGAVPGGSLAPAAVPHAAETPTTARAAVPAPAAAGIAPSTSSIWTNVSTTWAGQPYALNAPPATYGGAMVYDSKDGYSLFFGGVSTNKPYQNQTWAWKNNAWVNLSVAGSSPTGIVGAPPGMAFEAMTYDTNLSEAILFGGFAKNGSSAQLYTATWTYSGGVWTNITSTAGSVATLTGPEGRWSPAMAYDPMLNETVLEGGGIVGPATVPSVLGTNEKEQQETWVLSKTLVWSNVTATIGTQPPARDEEMMVYDAAEKAVVMEGGQTTKNVLLNDTWLFTKAGWTNVTGLSKVTPLGSTDGEDNGVRNSEMIYDSVDQTVVLYSGSDYSTNNDNSNVTYVFSNNTWVNAGWWETPTGHPPTVYPLLSGQPPIRVWAGAADFDVASGKGIFLGGDYFFNFISASATNWTWTYQWDNVSAHVSASPTEVPLSTSVTFTTVAHGGTWNYSYKYTGLPSGCVSKNKASWSCDPTLTGTYNVTVYANDTNAASGSALVEITVFEALSATLSIKNSSVDLGGSVTVNTTVSGGSSGLETYTYTGLPPGCGSTDAAIFLCTPRSPANGVYHVNVTVIDSVGDRVTVGPANFTVYPALKVSLARSVPVLDGGQTVWFNATVSGGDLSYFYAFSGLPTGCLTQDETNLSCTPGPTAQGPFEVLINVTDTTGTVKSGYQNVTVFPMLTASLVATPTAGREPVTVNFHANTSGGDPVVTFTWLLVGIEIETQQTFAYTFHTAGTFGVDLWVNDSLGVSLFHNTTIHILGPLPALVPSVSITPAQGKVDIGQTAVFTANATGGLKPYTFYWQPVSGCTANGAVFTCQPTRTGTIFTTVTINDSANNSKQKNAEIIVQSALGISIDYAVSTTCGAAEVNYTAAPAGGLNPYSVNWTFGDNGGTSAGPKASRTYPGAGNYSVTANVTDSTGATAQTLSYVLLTACTAGSGGGSSNTDLYIGAGVVGLIVVILLAVLVMRSRAAAAAGAEAAPPPPPEPKPAPAEGEEDEFIYGSDRPQSQDSFYVKPPEEGGGSS